MTSLRLVVADDSVLLREGLCLLLAEAVFEGQQTHILRYPTHMAACLGRAALHGFGDLKDDLLLRVLDALVQVQIVERQGHVGEKEFKKIMVILVQILGQLKIQKIL